MHGHPRHPELGLWATIHKKTGKFIGRCGLLPWTIESQNEVEIAYLLDREFWHQGLATEAANGILRHGFENLKLSRLICMIDPENTASQRVAERIGMKFERQVDGYEGDHMPFSFSPLANNNKAAWLTRPWERKSGINDRGAFRCKRPAHSR